MEWEWVEAGLEAAKKAGIRPGPGPLPDHVYAYTASIRKRIEGRGITLLGYVRSIISGKASFRCSNGHEWRTTPVHVGEGKGCPECGIGERDPEEILAAVFSTQVDASYRYYRGQADEYLELAYALTVHKAQGSDFEVVFLIVPQKASTLSRELIYTGLTRFRRKLVLLVEKDIEPSAVYAARTARTPG